MLGISSLGLSSPFLSAVVFLGFSFASPAQVPARVLPVNLTPIERANMVQSYATEKLWVWQHRLNLDDWSVSVVVARTTDLKPRTLGNIHWDSDNKTAVIRVLDPADYNVAGQAMLRDIEFTVVHELIHLELVPVLAPLQRTEANRRDEEHAVNHMADALLKLDRTR
jgi:hypothetical protein